MPRKLKQIIGKTWSDFGGFKLLDLDNIVIPRAFEESHPREEKLDECLAFLMARVILDRPIVVKKDSFELVDGYIGYLTAIKHGLHVSYGLNCNHKVKHTYIIGHFDNGNGGYAWEIDCNTRRFMYARRGEKALVETEYGNQIVTIDRLICSPCKQLAAVKKVIEIYPSEKLFEYDVRVDSGKQIDDAGIDSFLGTVIVR